MYLFDRDKELEILSAAFADCIDGSGQLVIITGGPGSGKTGLIDEFLNTAGVTDVTLLTATASVTGRSQPMDVVRQLLHNGGGSAASLDQVKCDTQSAHDVSGALLELAKDRPMVIAIDDAHLMDNASLQTVLRLLRQIRSKKIMVVCVSWEQSGPTGPRVHAELIRLPHRRVRLRPLSPQGVARLLAAQTDQPLPADASGVYHRTTAGNPMLLNALLDDSARFGTTIGEPVASVAYRQAVLDCLHRGDPLQLRVARAIAALGEQATAKTTAPLANASPGSVQEVVEVLDSTGLLSGYRFRHPAAASAVLGDLEPAERSRLHSAVARLLYLDGAPAPDVAKHLVAADQVTEPWGPAVLRLAAEQELAVDNVGQSTDFLQLALRECEDKQEWQALSAELARAEWRVNPAAAAPHLVPLRQAVLEETLNVQDTATVLRHMLWQGDAELAAETVTTLSGAHTVAEAQVMAEVDFIRHWFYGVPRVSRRADLTRTAVLERATPDSADSLWTKVALLVNGVATDESVANVAESLQSYQFSHLKLELVAMSLLAIAHTDRTAIAVETCDALLECAVERRATTWQALLSSIRAELAMLQGDVVTACTRATEALDLLHPQGWGVLVGLPLSTAVFAHTHLGNHAAAAELLKRKVPDTMFQTIFGIQYLRARGHHHLATDRAFGALNDFEACGQLMRDRNPDLQQGVPWRIDIAQANLRIGKVRLAKEWAEKQIRLPGGHSSRSHAMALRVLAGASQPRHRASLLRKAIDLLQACGDRLELSLAFADLSAAHYELGDYARARLVARQAAQEAEVCRIASPVGNRLDNPPPTGPPAGDDVAPILSDAECRVAGLAALGYTNREISSRIHVTVSTVEQHLTRVYRKLNVASRAELPSKVLEHRIPTMSERIPGSRSPAV
ncbi:AAA family ATPase [Streptomyces sp. NPDC088258]|uniref:helix-turn-helix transcriptional regulator n=1 Tax=Streptomyces sp. NPDC088258 TaxID=3365849 RepID=UPI003803DE36